MHIVFFFFMFRRMMIKLAVIFYLVISGSKTGSGTESLNTLDTSVFVISSVFGQNFMKVYVYLN
jgi:hypothetical protein